MIYHFNLLGGATPLFLNDLTMAKKERTLIIDNTTEEDVDFMSERIMVQNEYLANMTNELFLLRSENHHLKSQLKELKNKQKQ